MKNDGSNTINDHSMLGISDSRSNNMEDKSDEEYQHEEFHNNISNSYLDRSDLVNNDERFIKH